MLLLLCCQFLLKMNEGKKERETITGKSIKIEDKAD